MFDVGDPTRNVVLTMCIAAIALLTLAALVPWRALGAPNASRLARWIVLPVAALAVVYESAMPARFDIRVDLLLLLPLYALVLAASLVRWLR
jgi:hypothetical protein